MIDRTYPSLEQLHVEEAAAIFKVLADPARLRTLIILAGGEHNVGEIAKIEGEKIGTISARLRVLLQARLVKRRRAGKEAIYSIADAHVLNLVSNTVEHVREHH
jgi:DNA-binding transcriptional ArsR family regulator